jgi:hypothetical protein
VRRLKALETENARLKKLVAERDLEIEVMKEIAQKLVSVWVRREAVACATGRGLSQNDVAGSTHRSRRQLAVI